MEHRKTIGNAVQFWRRTPILLVVLAVELLLLLYSLWGALQPPVSYRFTPEELEDISQGVELTYDENGYYGITYDIEGQDILQTPQLSLVPGNYRATVTYAYSPTKTADGRIHHSNIKLTDPSNVMSVSDGAMVLDDRYNTQTITLSVYQPTDTARIIFHNDGGTYTVGGITMTQDMGFAALCTIGLLLACIAVNLVLLCIMPSSPLYKGRSAAIVFLVLTCAVVLASAPLLTEGVDLRGADSVYHLERIEGIAEGLRCGQFPVRLNPMAKSGYGYGNSMFYGELFLYFPAILRLLGVSIQSAYKAYAIAVQIATVVIAYRSFRPIFGRNIALAGTVIYLLTPYRLHRFYDPMAVGEYTAMTFLPAIVYGLWLLYHGTPTDKDCRKATLVLALSYSALLQCHMITLELSVLVGAVVCLLLWRKTFRRPVLLSWIKACVLALLLNLWFLVPFLGNMLTGLYGRVSTINIQSNGATFAKLLYNNNDFSVGIPLLLCGVFAALFVFSDEKSAPVWRRLCMLSLGIGCVALFLTTDVFPWNSLTGIPVIGRLLQVIQFPWRYSTIAALTLVIAALATAAAMAGTGQKYKAQVILGSCTVMAVMSTLLYWNSYIPTINATSLVDTCQLYYEHKYNANSNILLDLDNLYVPTTAIETNDGFVYNEIVTSVTLGDFTQERGVTSVEYNEYLGQEGYIEFPLLYYPGYQVVEGSGSIFMTANGMVGVAVPAGSSGTVAVAFREARRWMVADVISAITALALAGGCAYRKRRKPSVPKV